MRKSLFSAAAALVLAPALAFAQSGNAPVNASMDVKAEIITPLTVAIDELDFGVVVAGAAKTIGFDAEDRAGNDRAAAGRVHISGDVRFPVQITFVSIPTQLTSGENTVETGLLFCFFSSEAAAPTTSERSMGCMMNSGSATTGMQFTMAPETMHRQLYFFGNVVTAPGQPSGDYSAQAALRAEYTGI